MIKKRSNGADLPVWQGGLESGSQRCRTIRLMLKRVRDAA